MKFKTDKTPAGLTTVALREEEALLVVEDRSGELERIDIDFTAHQIRVYSDGTWEVNLFKRNGTPIESDNPLTAVVMHFRDGAGLRQGFKTPVPQSVAMAAIGRFVADVGDELDMKPE
jgi:hypothetical protein